MNHGVYGGVWFKVQDRDNLFSSVESLRDMAEWLGRIGKPAAAKVVTEYADDIVEAGERLEKTGWELKNLLKAAEFVASSDWGPEEIDEAFYRLKAPTAEHPICPECRGIAVPETTITLSGDPTITTVWRCRSCARTYPIASYITPPCPKCGELMTVIIGEGDTSISGLFLKCENCGRESRHTTRRPGKHE